MASSIAICNMALGFLGQNPILNLLDPQNSQEQLCAQYYDVARLAILEEAQWSFAMKRVVIEGEVAAPEWGYGNAHTLPGDVIRVLFVGLQQDERKFTNFDWRLEDGRILANQNKIFVRYTADVTDTTKFSPLFVQCLAARLAADMCIAITENRQLKDQLTREYEGKLQMAVTMNSMQGRSEKLKTGRLISQRGSGYMY